MGLNRRKFTREFKEDSVRQLKLGHRWPKCPMPTKSTRMSCIADGASCAGSAAYATRLAK